jgi:hypothetical protein
MEEIGRGSFATVYKAIHVVSSSHRISDSPATRAKSRLPHCQIAVRLGHSMVLI